MVPLDFRRAYKCWQEQEGGGDLVAWSERLKVCVRSDCPACVMEWVIVSTIDSGHLGVGDGGEEGVEEAGLVR